MTEENQERPYRTKVQVGNSSLFGPTQKFVMAYSPSFDSEGYIELDSKNCVKKLEKLGGVKSGTVGEISGPVLRVPRAFLHEADNQNQVGIAGAQDLIEIVSVDLQEYQKTAWFPTANIRVIG